MEGFFSLFWRLNMSTEEKKYEENQTGTEPGTLIVNSPLRHLMAV